MIAWLRRSELARRLAAFFGMFAVVVQLGLPIAHDPAGLGAVAPWLGAAICHVGGAAPAAPTDKKSALCPFCLGLQGTAAALPPPHPAMMALTSAATSEPLPSIRFAAPSGHDPGSPRQPRAPPASV